MHIGGCLDALLRGSRCSSKQSRCPDALRDLRNQSDFCKTLAVSCQPHEILGHQFVCFSLQAALLQSLLQLASEPQLASELQLASEPTVLFHPWSWAAVMTGEAGGVALHRQQSNPGWQPGRPTALPAMVHHMIHSKAINPQAAQCRHP